MPRRRDRHDRGLRGPIALPNPYTGRVVPLRRSMGRQDFFTGAVTEAVARIGRTYPGGLDGVDVGVEEVPYLATMWSGDRVPLGVCVEATSLRPAQIVVYRRPLEHRAATRGELRDLVHRTLVEQLAALTAQHVRDIDPELDDEDW
ncbi:metallopeptidase family protein [Luteococcus peritonei]|uniref:Metallopeptidase family protein n=1 Tax=Luteococcus peritonei TaxID=88874 RepID=A0ABW4RWS9_9ACTN